MPRRLSTAAAWSGRLLVVAAAAATVGLASRVSHEFSALGRELSGG